MGVYGLVWVRVDALIRKEAKTRQKEEQMGEQDIFAIHGQGQKEGGTQQRRKRAPKNITGENNWKSRSVRDPKNWREPSRMI